MAKKKASKKTREPLVVGSKVKGFIRSKGLQMAKETLDALNCSVYCLLESAVKRAEANGRKTVKPQDV